jgi:hypothetical protein
MTARTEQHPAGAGHGLDGEGQKGLPKEVRA